MVAHLTFQSRYWTSTKSVANLIPVWWTGFSPRRIFFLGWRLVKKIHTSSWCYKFHVAWYDLLQLLKLLCTSVSGCVALAGVEPQELVHNKSWSPARTLRKTAGTTTTSSSSSESRLGDLPRHSVLSAQWQTKTLCTNMAISSFTWTVSSKLLT